VQIALHCPYEFSRELFVLVPGAGDEKVSSSPVHHDVITTDLSDLVEETFVRGVLAEKLDPEPESVSVDITPVWRVEPFVERVRVEVRTTNGKARGEHTIEFARGRWTRGTEPAVHRLREEGVVEPEQQVFLRVLAVNGQDDTSLYLPPLQAPEIYDQSLADLGVRRLLEGSVDPERPVLVNQRAVDEILELTVKNGTSETGGGMLGKIVRLPEPLDGASTRIVTVLTTGVPDERHVGTPGRLDFNPQALIDAAQIATARDLGEVVLTAYHSHGWWEGAGCDQCPHQYRSTCVLPECSALSPDDYQVLDSLFPSKATLMPVAGIRQGAPVQSPVLEIHAWSGGTMSPVAWRAYDA